MVGWWLAMALAAPLVAPEPVLEFATVDVKALRQSRVWMGAATGAPMVTHVGALLPPTETGFGVESAGGGAIYVVGSLSSLVLPVLADRQAQRSRRALVEQGLSVPRVSAAGASLLVGVPALVALGEPLSGDAPPVSRVAAYYALSALALALPANQLRVNRKARVEAQWLHE